MGIEIQETYRGRDEGSPGGEWTRPVAWEPEPEQANVQSQPVTVIEQHGDAVLVQWLEGGAVNRAWMPSQDIRTDATGTYASVEVGIAYGDRFDVRDFTISEKQITDALHGAGLWTWAEVRANPKKVQGVIHKLSDELLSTVLSTAQVREKQHNG